MTRALVLCETYSRQDVHDIFDPGTRFTPQAGTWGLWGIVPVAGKAGDFVFFVTFGKEQAGYHFDEWVSQNGVINWQSQPRQSLADRQIQQFIHHIPTNNNIYLFLRTKKTVPYTYLGPLAYFTHDPDRERPVHIQWQILDWNPSSMLLQQMGLSLRMEEPQLDSQDSKHPFFEWRGVQYSVDLEQLLSKIRQEIKNGLPIEAIRFRDWYVEIHSVRISAKWVFHLITGADYSEFDAPTARDKLEKIGIHSYEIRQIAETATQLSGSGTSIFPPTPKETTSPSLKPEEKQPLSRKVGFTWQRKEYRYDAQQLQDALKKAVKKGLSEEALSFKTWYVSSAGMPISPKYIFKRTTETEYEQFTIHQACEKLQRLGLHIFYQANPSDIQRSCSIQLTQTNLAVADAHISHQTFAQALFQNINPSFRTSKLIFPNSQNRREIHFDLAGLGKSFLRQNKDGVLEFSFEFNHPFASSNTLLQKLTSKLPEAIKILGYTVYVNKQGKDSWRLGSETIEIDEWLFDFFDDGTFPKLKGKNVPAHWDLFYQNIKLAHPNSKWEELADIQFGMALAEFVNTIAPIIQQAVPSTQLVNDNEDPIKLPEKKMVKKRNYIGSTIRRLTDLLLDLARFGEIGSDALSTYGLTDSHVLQVVQSGWAISTPYALVATPYLLNLLPIENQDRLNELLHLSNFDYQGWGNFEEKAFQILTGSRYPQLGFGYIYSHKTNSFVHDSIWRPTWLVNYLPENDWDDWNISALLQTKSCHRETKYYVHSALHIQNNYGGTAEVQDAVWKTAFYWLMLQLIILSDPRSGAAYDPNIRVYLSNGWRDGSVARLYIQDDYVGDLLDCLEPLMACFHWVWVNRSCNSSQDHQSILGLLRLLLKIDVAELGKDGRLIFTDAYRIKLFESQQKANTAWRGSKDERDQLREVIKQFVGK